MQKSKKKILAITGIRSEYDILFPVLSELRNLEHDLKVVISGAHLSDNHGNTWQRIRDDGFDIADKIDSLLATDRITQRAKGVGILIQGLTQTVEQIDPDCVIVVGDREESIAAAIVCNYLNKLLVHIGGGDPVFGNADDPIRFAVSKLAHLHCTTHKEYAENLINMGEEEFRVFFTGNPAYVNINNTPKISLENLLKDLNISINQKDFIVFIQHPLSSELDQTERHIKTSLSALEKFSLTNNYITICISPNSDPGSEIIKENIFNYQDEKWFFALDSLDRKHFVNLIRHAKALVGNSSMGILEAPHYKLPVVNIGNRQKGRLNAGNVIFVNNDVDEVVVEIEKACLDTAYREKVKKLANPYGDGTAAKKIVNIIESLDISDPNWYIKKKLIP